MIELDDYRFSEDKIRKFQALWKGVNVRQRMKEVQDEYVKLFKELENSSMLEVQWASVLSKPKFLSDRDKLKSSKAAPVAKIQSYHSTLKTADSRPLDEIPELERPTHIEDVIQFSKPTEDAVTQTSRVADSLENHDVLTDARLASTDLNNPSVSHHEIGLSHQGHAAKTSDVYEERRNLALELLWIQQAIVSRKQYLHHKTKIVQLGSR